MGKPDAVCLRCEDAVAGTKPASGGQILGLVFVLVGLFFWPLIILGLILMVFGGGKRQCPRCKSPELVPLDSSSGRRVLEGRR